MVSHMTTSDGCGCAVTADPYGAAELVVAGGAYSAGCAVTDTPAADCQMAIINFPVQTYVAGFCPTEALQAGTLFPELVSVYQRGC